MPKFIINKNKQDNGDHEVHNATTGCSHMPDSKNQVDLGNHTSSREAVAYTKRELPKNRINGCIYCCKDSHTS